MNIFEEINRLEEKYGEEFTWYYPAEKTFHIKEAYREIGEEHALWNKELTLIAACTFCDDILFSTDDDSMPYVIIHLTYNENQKGFPKYQAFSYCEDVIKYIEDEFVLNYLCDPKLIRERGLTI